MPTTFRDLIADNKRKSVLLVVIFCLFTAAVALLLGLAIIAYFDPDTIAHLNWTEGLIVGGLAAGIAFLISLISYYEGASMILGISGARLIAHKDDPVLFNVVEEMAIAAGIPVPKVYLIHDPAPNAFATGRDPQHGAVAITTGLREKLTRDELQGVIAHEVSHIRNYDIRLMLLLAVLVGTIVMLADFFWQILRFSGGKSSSSSGGSKDSGKGGGGIVVIILFVMAIILAIIAPILAQIIQLAVSRQREYLADASGVELTRNPLGLANALRKIDADPHDLKTANRGTAHLYIANPIKKFADRAESIFASHPPIKDRIARLEALVHA
ncbi:MAG TPA: M48 family metallopeptidase [Gemmataceae bacterium]|nr:M48 family metallopeptidase [Gemmataceae bacterium]